MINLFLFFLFTLIACIGVSFALNPPSIMNKEMLLHMSCFNLKRICLGNLYLFDDVAIKILCNNLNGLQEFVIDDKTATTRTGIAYLIQKFSGSLTLFIDLCHQFSEMQIYEFALVLKNIIKLVVELEDTGLNCKEEVEANFKGTCVSKDLKVLSICHRSRTHCHRKFPQLSWWNSKEPRVRPVIDKEFYGWMPIDVLF